MAMKEVSIAFDFEEIDGIKYNVDLDHDFTSGHPAPGDAIQPIVFEAYTKIKQCLGDSIDSIFNFGKCHLVNVSNTLHIGRTVIEENVSLDNSGPGPKTAPTFLILEVKFFRFSSSGVYRVFVDLQEMPILVPEVESKHWQMGFSNKKVDKLVELLDERFSLHSRIEFLPILKRGSLDIPKYLVSSDERVLEYDFERVLFHKKSQYQDVKILKSPSLGNTLILDNLQNLAEDDFEYTYGLMNRGKMSYKNKEILILGGGDGGLIWELLKEDPKFVTMAEIDPVVIDACHKFMRPFGKVFDNLKGTNYEIIVDDCKAVMQNAWQSGKRFDVIFNDLTDIPVVKYNQAPGAFDPSVKQKDNPWHFIETIFNLSMDLLSENGMYLTHANGKGSTQSLKAFEEFLSNSKHKVCFEKRFSYVPSFMETWVFYSIKKRDITAGVGGDC